MPDGNWRSRLSAFITGWPAELNPRVSYWDFARFFSSVLLLAFTGLLLVSAGQGVWSWHDANTQAYEEQKKRSDAEQKQASERIASECAVMFAPADLVAKCLASAVEAYEAGKNTDADLKAQMDMAFWAKLMFIATTASLGISLLGLYFLMLSLRQTREAISTDREVGHAQVRAYVDVTPLGMDMIAEGKALTVHFKIENTGQSPAKRLQYIAYAFLAEPKLVADTKTLVVPIVDIKHGGSTIKAGGHIFGDASTDGPLAKSDIDMMADCTTHRMYVAGLITYLDVFNTEQWTKFCYYIQAGNGPIKVQGREGKLFNWVTADTHNEAS
jgi:hypothetical protein